MKMKRKIRVVNPACVPLQHNRVQHSCVRLVLHNAENFFSMQYSEILHEVKDIASNGMGEVRR